MAITDSTGTDGYFLGVSDCMKYIRLCNGHNKFLNTLIHKVSFAWKNGVHTQKAALQFTDVVFSHKTFSLLICAGNVGDYLHIYVPSLSHAMFTKMHAF